MKIRKTTERDAQALLDYIVAIKGEGLKTIFQQDRTYTLEDELNLIRRSDGKHGALFICLDDERIVGMINGSRHAKPQLNHSCAFGVTVLAGYRSQGIGTMLIKAFITWARGRKLKRVELSVISNNTDGIRLYKRLGFIVEGRKVKAVKVGGRYVDLVDMVKKI